MLTYETVKTWSQNYETIVTSMSSRNSRFLMPQRMMEELHLIPKTMPLIPTSNVAQGAVVEFPCIFIALAIGEMGQARRATTQQRLDKLKAAGRVTPHADAESVPSFR